MRLLNLIDRQWLEYGIHDDMTVGKWFSCNFVNDKTVTLCAFFCLFTFSDLRKICFEKTFLEKIKCAVIKSKSEHFACKILDQIIQEII